MADMDDPAAAPAPDKLDDLFLAWRRGEAGAFDSLFSQLYEHMRRLAHAQATRAGAAAGETMRTTAIVHEAYLRLAGNPAMDVQGREHFISLAARAMRFVLVDHARRKTADKHGGGMFQVTLGDSPEMIAATPTADEVLLVDQALERLSALSPRQAQVFELRAFGGLTIEEIAALLDISRETTKRDWQKARLFIARALDADAAP